MSFILGAVYYIMGILMAFGAFAAIGWAFCALIALLKISRPGNSKLLAGYVFMAGLAAVATWCGLPIAGWIGDHTAYKGQIGLIVGACFPGILAISLIPNFVKIAMRQTDGHIDG